VQAGALRVERIECFVDRRWFFERDAARRFALLTITRRYNRRRGA